MSRLMLRFVVILMLSLLSQRGMCLLCRRAVVLGVDCCRQVYVDIVNITVDDAGCDIDCYVGVAGVAGVDVVDEIAVIVRVVVIVVVVAYMIFNFDIVLCVDEVVVVGIVVVTYDNGYVDVGDCWWLVCCL